MIKTKRKPVTGLFYDIGIQGQPKGVILARVKNKPIRLMLLHDYLAYKGGSKHTLFVQQQNLGKRIITKIAGRDRFGYLVSIDDEEVPEYISDENGIFEIRVGNRFRKAQTVEQYRQQHGYASKALVAWKMRQGRDCLQTAVLNRYASKQNLLFVLLPIKNKCK